MTKIIPNTFQTFNAYVDVALELLTPEETKCLLFATRHILGWQDKISARRGHISLSAFEKGFVTSDGTRFGGTGLNRKTIIKAVDELDRFGLVVKVGKPTTKGQLYELGESPNWTLIQERSDAKREGDKGRTKKARLQRQQNRTGVSHTPVEDGVSDTPEAVYATHQQQSVAHTDAGVSDTQNQSHIQNQDQSQFKTFSPDGEDFLEFEDTGDSTGKQALYLCTPQDIAALIATWYDWCPKLPTRRGKVIPLRDQIANTTNREYAENLFQRGVRPADFASCLGVMRLEPPKEGWPEMTFCFNAKAIEEWVAIARQDNFYSEEFPRITPRKPGVVINMGDVLTLTPEELASKPDLIVDIPPPYISPHDAEQDVEEEFPL